MTFFDLARKNAWRKPLRATLLMICVAVAFLIYGLTASFVNGSQGASEASDDLLGVMSAAGRSQPLPLSYMNRIAAEPDVAALNYMIRLRGFVAVERNVVAVSALDPQRLTDVSGKELGLTRDLVDALSQERDKVLVGRALAEAQGWRVGQNITVTSGDALKQDGSRDWSFDIAGIFDGENASTDTYFVIARYDYLNAGRARNRDTVDGFIVRPQSNVSSGELAVRIDQMFANSAAPTKTQSEKQFLEAFLRQYADVGLIVDLVVSAAFITLLMIVVNTMVFAVRERTFEIGVLKTLGFSGTQVMVLILGETLFIFAVGGGLGLGLAKLATILSDPSLGLVFSTPVLAKAVGMIAVLGLVTGALPAFNALRTPVVSAFRER
ncbi:ABC transporter permease [Agrobacterium rosae]|uniref:FtsX-like permease family protein n=1 Tax=Agrobacterium rosae TaxID=1972867 RepID=A0AAW9FK69_9HYPH|nr:FtsX-like permease family protein [Agrobacterium rosae]MDX8305536.1 FtsX-like permease family protein [Agrobacterium rosae]